MIDTTLSQTDLLQRAVDLVKEERRITLALIETLREISRRRIHETLGYPSLHVFCVDFLGLSDGAAARRIAALRLSSDLPEVKEKLESGSLTLSSASALQSFFRNQAKLGRPASAEQKRTVLASVEGLSRADTERTLLAIEPAAVPRERERVVSATETELKLVLDAKTLQKLKKLENYWSQGLRKGTRAELLEKMIDECLSREEKKRFGKQTEEPKLAQPHSAAESGSKPGASKPSRPAIPVAIKRSVWKKAEGKCEYVSPEGHRCGSTRYLEIDHVDVWSKMDAPTHDPKRLRLLCHAHNIHYAAKTLGEEKMQKYRSSLDRAEHSPTAGNAGGVA